MLYLLVFLAGALLPVQAGINGELARHLGHPLRASLISFLVGSLFLFLLVQRLAPGPGEGWGRSPFGPGSGGLGVPSMSGASWPWPLGLAP
ncbi:DMT family transporter [Thermus scotoductus]|uniref:DMT family transporter n=1 Tax=Thermus scotoductus TaxID=37636 RepID=UPI000690325B